LVIAGLFFPLDPEVGDHASSPFHAHATHQGRKAQEGEGKPHDAKWGR
jgi:hypothetical protein